MMRVSSSALRHTAFLTTRPSLLSSSLPASSCLFHSQQRPLSTSQHQQQQQQQQQQQHNHQEHNHRGNYWKNFQRGTAILGGVALAGAVAVPLAPNSNRAEDQGPFVASLSNVLSSPSSSLFLSNVPSISSYLKGIRIGKGAAIAVVRPKNMEELVKIISVCAEYGVAIVPQGRNTGLTGGSVPRDEKINKTDRPCVVLSTELISGITLLEPSEGQEGKQALCLAGTGIQNLQKTTGDAGLSSHSVLGSLFLNPTTAAGVAFGSGGTLLRVGPSYTDRILSVRINENSEVEVISTLGVKGDSLEDMLKAVQNGEEFSKKYNPDCCQQTTYVVPQGNNDFSSIKGKEEKHFEDGALCSMTSYTESVCNLNDTVSRYNADTSGEPPVRSEGKCVILASIHDAPPQPKESNLMWVSCDSFDTAVEIKKRVVLVNPQDLPVMCEYMNKDSVISTSAGGSFLMYVLQYLGMKNLAIMWGIKSKLDVSPLFGNFLIDRIMVWISEKLPTPIPAPVKEMTEKFDHHLLINLADFGGGEIKRQRERTQKILEEVGANRMEIYEAQSAKEAGQMKNFRFVITAAFAAYCNSTGMKGVSVDYALQKKDGSIPALPEGCPDPIMRLRYMHFGCNVVHEDIAFPVETTPENATKAKLDFKASIEAEHGAKLPAEHGHGIEYKVPADMVARWKKLDPLNMFNPGIGKTSNLPRYGEDQK